MNDEKFWCQTDCGRTPSMEDRHPVILNGKRKYLCDDCYQDYILEQEQGRE